MALNPENRIPTTAGTNEIFFDRNTGKISYKNNLGIVTPLEGSNITNISQSAEDGLNFNFKEGSVGPKVSFSKASGTDPATHKDVIIPGQLEITRSNSGGGIYNIAQESNFNSGNSPRGTVWNTQYVTDTDTSWAPLWDIENRTYDTWRNAINAEPPQYVGMPAIMRYDSPIFGQPSRYWLVLFTEWGVGNNGEYGFAYDRYEIYEPVDFTRPDYEPNVVDVLSAGVHIGRKNNGGQIYNVLTEPSANSGVSPEHTKWNSIYTDSRIGYSGYKDLSNLESRVFNDFANALGNNVGVNILGTDLIMWDLTTDLYYEVNFTDWTSGGHGGGFSYRRTVIPQSCGIKFADGTVLNTAKGFGSAGVQSVTDDGNGGITVNNADPLNPIIDFTGVSTDGTTVSGIGTSANPLSAPFQSPAVDGVTITGDGTPGNPLVAAGGGGAVNYANVLFVDSTNGDDGTALQNDFTKPYASPAIAMIAATSLTPTYYDRTLIYIRRGTYINQYLVLQDYTDYYCEPGVVFVNSCVYDNSTTVNANFFGKATFSDFPGIGIVFRANGANSKIYFECDEINSTAGIIETGNSASATIVARKMYATTNTKGFGITVRGSGTVVINVSESISAWHQTILFKSFSGKCTVNCPKLVMATGNIYGGNNKQVVISADNNTGGQVTINADLVNEDAGGYIGGISGMITRWTATDNLLLRVNGNIYAGDFYGYYALGSTGNSLTVITGDITSNQLCGFASNNSKVVIRNGNLINKKTYVPAAGYPVVSMGGSAVVYFENCMAYGFGTDTDFTWKDTTGCTLVVSNVTYSALNATGWFVKNTVGGTPVNNVRLHNVRSQKALHTNITDLLSPTGFIFDTNTLTPNFL